MSPEQEEVCEEELCEEDSEEELCDEVSETVVVEVEVTVTSGPLPAVGSLVAVQVVVAKFGFPWF